MPAALIYKLAAAIFTKTGGSPITLTGATQATETPNADKRTTRADGAVGITSIYMEGHSLQVQISLESNDAATLAAALADLKLGAVGVLTLLTKKQAAGVDFVASGDQLRTYPAATAAAGSRAVLVAGPTAGFPIDGNPTTSLTFEVFESDGDYTKFVSVAAP